MMRIRHRLFFGACIFVGLGIDQALAFELLNRPMPQNSAYTSGENFDSVVVDAAQYFATDVISTEEIDFDAQEKVLGSSLMSNAPTQSGTKPEQYSIGSTDILEFVMFSDESLSREITVRYDGYISLPRIGDVHVGGLSRSESEDKIESQYGRIYKNPEVSLAVVEPHSKSYTVAGDVENPGQYPYKRSVGVWDAIQQAGGPRIQRFGTNSFGSSATGQIAKAYIIRNTSGARQVFSFDLRNIEQAGAFPGDTTVQFGDIIYVPGGVNLIYVLGESRGSSVVQLTEGLTVMKALALAGGAEGRSARLKSIALLRELPNEQLSVTVIDIKEMLKEGGQDYHLLPGDIIYIPRKRSIRVQEMISRLTDIPRSVLGLYSDAVDAVYSEQLNEGALQILETNAD
jgi:polysaccharide export outer membrane protein